MVEVEMVTITKEEYDELIESRDWENALEIAGVDNWEGYDFARDVYNDIRTGLI